MAGRQGARLSESSGFKRQVHWGQDAAQKLALGFIYAFASAW